MQLSPKSYPSQGQCPSPLSIREMIPLPPSAATCESGVSSIPRGIPVGVGHPTRRRFLFGFFLDSFWGFEMFRHMIADGGGRVEVEDASCSRGRGQGPGLSPTSLRTPTFLPESPTPQPSPSWFPTSFPTLKTTAAMPIHPPHLPIPTRPGHAHMPPMQPTW